MKKAFGNIFNRRKLKTTGSSIASNTDVQLRNSKDHQTSGSHDHQGKRMSIIVDIATPTLSQSSSTQYKHAILVEASSTTFGNECLRLVNIVFQTSQTFQSIMGTCGNISQYLQKELFKKYPWEYFHITIGENNAFGFAIEDGDYFAEMEQDQYRVIIFTTRFNRNINLIGQFANSEMMLEWTPYLDKQSRK